jgi:hypothetical protein
MPSLSGYLSAASAHEETRTRRPAPYPFHRTQVHLLQSATRPVLALRRRSPFARFVSCRFKTHSSFLPIRRGFLHRSVSKPPRPQPDSSVPEDTWRWPWWSRYSHNQYRRLIPDSLR